MVKNLKNIIIITIVSITLILFGTKVYASTGKTINNSTRIRAKADTKSDIVEEVSKNEELEVVSKEGEWYKVKYKTSKGTVEGYVREDLLEVKEEVTSSEKTENKKESEDEKEAENTQTEETTELKENSEVEIESDIQIRVVPLFFANQTGKISKNSKVKITEIIGNWCHIQDDKQDGWVLKSKLKNTQTVENTEKEENKKEDTKQEETKKEESKTEEKKMYVSTTTLNLREKADTKSDVLTQLDINNQVTVIEKVDSTWSKIKYKNYTGYVATKYLSDKKTEVTSRSSQEPRNNENTESNTTKNDTKEEETKKEETKKEETKKEETKKEETKKEETKKESKKEDNSSDDKKTSSKKSSSKSSEVTGSDIVAYAKKFLGYKYVYGTAGPNTFDCSGFTSYVYKHFGYSITRTSSSQRSDGVGVSKSKLQAGDIVCFSGHVGIYIGDGDFIHAANPKKGVIISSLSESYYKKNYITARRILD